MNATATATPALAAAIDRILLLAATAKVTGRTDENLLDSLNAIENAARVAILEHLESIAPQYDNDDDVPF